MKRDLSAQGSKWVSRGNPEAVELCQDSRNKRKWVLKTNPRGAMRKRLEISRSGHQECSYALLQLRVEHSCFITKRADLLASGSTIDPTALPKLATTAPS